MRAKKKFLLEIYRRTMSVWKSVGESGISSKYFATLAKIPMDNVCLEIRR